MWRGVWLAAALAMLAAVPAAGQTPGRYTIGGQAVGFRYLLDEGPSLFLSCNCFAPGAGWRFTAALNGKLGVDGAFNFWPPQRGIPGHRDWAAEVLLGPRYRLAGGPRLAFFLAARPGWIWLHRVGYQCCLPPSGSASALTGPSAADSGLLDLGVSVEIGLSQRWLLRLGVGGVLFFPPRSSANVLPATSDRLSAGIAYRF